MTDQPSIHAVLLTDDSGHASWLRTVFDGGLELLETQAGRSADLQRLIADMGQEVSLIFVNVTTENQAARITLIEDLSETLAGIPVIAIGEGEEAQLMIQSMRAGARDFLVPFSDDAAALQAVEKVLKRTASVVARSQVKRGKLVNVMSAAPNDGISFLAAHLALAMGENLPAGERVLLIDLSYPPGNSMVFLNLDSEGYGVLDALGDVYRCDQTLIDTAFKQHQSGLYVLSLPDHIVGPPLVDSDELSRLLDTLMNYFSVIVVASDSVLGVRTLKPVVQMAGHSLVVTDQSILRSRQNLQLIKALKRDDCALDRMALVVDRYRKRVGLEPDRLAEILDLPFMTTLTGKTENRIQSMNTGEPLFSMAARDEYCAEVRALAARISGQTATITEDNRGVLGRLFS